MNAVRVFLATTEGPSEIQRIAEEDPEVRSVVCVNGTSDALPISTAYDSFVRKPTGVIERHFGHPVFRMDVSGRISDGRSWQLGMFAAHALHDAGRLATTQEAVEGAIWLTGEVDHDLGAAPVEHVPEKLRQSGRLFSELKAAGIPLTVFLPSGNAGELDKGWLKMQGFGKDGFRVVPVDSAAEVCRHLGLADPLAADAPPDAAAESGRKPPVGRIAAVAAALAVAASAFAVWQSDLGAWLDLADRGKYRALDMALADTADGDCLTCKAAARLHGLYADWARLPAADFQIAAMEHRAPGAKSCTVLNFGRVKAEEVPVPATGAGRLTASSAKGLCAVEYRLVNSGDRPVHVWLAVEPRYKTARPTRTVPALESGEVAPGGELAAAILMPRWLRRPLTNRITAVIAARPSNGVGAWLAPDGGGQARDWTGLLPRFERAGLTVVTTVHEVTP